MQRAGVTTGKMRGKSAGVTVRGLGKLRAPKCGHEPTDLSELYDRQKSAEASFNLRILGPRVNWPINAID